MVVVQEIYKRNPHTGTDYIRLECTCDHCGRTFYRQPTHGTKYCSQRCYAPHRTRPLAERFWEKVRRSDDPEACWLWTGSRSSAGYGGFVVEGRQHGAHRVSWELTYGPIPPDLFVCHRCDTPSCVNPAHLFLGTVTDNNQDALHKGRLNVPHYNGRGEQHPAAHRRDYFARGTHNKAAKLTEEAVQAIRTAAVQGETISSLSRRFGVSRYAIRECVNGRTWQHVLSPMPP